MRQTLSILCAQPEVSAGGDSEVWQQDWDLSARQRNGALSQRTVEESPRDTPALHDANKTAFTVRLKIQRDADTQGKLIRLMAKRAVELRNVHDKLDTMSELYSCRRSNTRGDFIFTPACILATPFKSSGLCAAGGLLWPAVKLCKHSF